MNDHLPSHTAWRQCGAVDSELKPVLVDGPPLEELTRAHGGRGRGGRLLCCRRFSFATAFGSVFFGSSRWKHDAKKKQMGRNGSSNPRGQQQKNIAAGGCWRQSFTSAFEKWWCDPGCALRLANLCSSHSCVPSSLFAEEEDEAVDMITTDAHKTSSPPLITRTHTRSRCRVDLFVGPPLSGGGEFAGKLNAALGSTARKRVRVG